MFIVFLFLIGICVGSFLNVLIDRIPAKKSVLYGRSQCDFCKKKLSALDLVPIFSFFLLRGKCRYCHKKLSWQYSLVEVLTGTLFISIFLFESPISYFQWVLTGIDITLVCVSLTLVIMDIKYRMLSDYLLIFFGLLSLIRIVMVNPYNFPMNVLIGFLSSLPLFLIFLLTKGKGMGFGDVKLVALLGFLLGLPNIVICYYLAFLTGAVAGVILILREKRHFRGATIAFGPFLFLGAGLAILFGQILWNYVKIFLGF